MTRVFMDDGSAVPVTAISGGECYVTDIKTVDRDGYTAVQIGFDSAKKMTKAMKGHLKGLNVRHLKEFRVDSVDGIEKGKKIDVSTFVVGDLVKVVGKTKGRGFQGVVKRHGFKGSPASHGHKDQLRMPGSIGATDAARVFKGKRMGGHMGNAQSTVANLEVIKVDLENNILFLKGAVPGARGSLLSLKADGELTFVEDKPETVVTSEEVVSEDSVKTNTDTDQQVDDKEDSSENDKSEEKNKEDKTEEKAQSKEVTSESKEKAEGGSDSSSKSK